MYSENHPLVGNIIVFKEYKNFGRRLRSWNPSFIVDYNKMYANKTAIITHSDEEGSSFMVKFKDHNERYLNLSISSFMCEIIPKNFIPLYEYI